MTDDIKELLALAAKACGIEATGYNQKLGLQYINGSEDSPFTDFWNPATDQADSDRMGAELRMNVEWHDFHVWVSFHCEKYSDHNNDKAAALRMARLRCAAEIGRSMSDD